jgi:hypothetical protein
MEFEQYPRQHFATGSYANVGALDMSTMANALPDYQMRQFQQQPYAQQYPAASTPNQSVMYQYQQGAQFAGQAVGASQSFAQQYPAQYAPGAQTRPQQPGGYQQPTGHPHLHTSQQSFQNQPYFIQPAFSQSFAGQYPQQQQAHIQQAQISLQSVPYASRVPSGFSVPQLRLDSSLTQMQPTSMYSQIFPPGKCLRPVFDVLTADAD